MKNLPHPRFLAFLAVFAGGAALASPWVALETAAILGFDAGALVFVAAALPLWAKDRPRDARARALRDDGGRVLLIVVAAAVMAVILLALGRVIGGREGAAPLELVVGTLVLAWLFANLVFGFHYAHMFYDQHAGQDAGGIAFPDAEPPLFADFVYFAFTIGMTCQTADLAITARRVRRVVTLHGLFAFFFNIGVLALSLNVLSGVLQAP